MDTTTPRWYAMKVFFNRAPQVKTDLEDAGAECYLPMHTVIRDRGTHRQKIRRPLVSSLLFFRCPPKDLPRITEAAHRRAMLYTRTAPDGTRRPAPIPDREMQIFRLVADAGSEGLEYIPEPAPALLAGRRVRVTAGPLAGAEGHILRIRGDRRLVVSIRGVCAVATAYIPQCFLETI